MCLLSVCFYIVCLSVENPSLEKRKDPTLHVVCSLIPEIHFTVDPTRNAISAILNGHRIIVQALLVIPNEDVEGLSDHLLPCPSLLLAHMFQPPQVISSLCHKTAQGKTIKSKHRFVLIFKAAVQWMKCR